MCASRHVYIYKRGGSHKPWPFFPQGWGEQGEPIAGPALCPQGLCHHTEQPSFPKGSTAMLEVFLPFLLPTGWSVKMCWGTNTSMVRAAPRIGKGTLLGSHRATAASSAGQKTLAAAPHAEGNQRDFFKQIRHSSMYPSNTSLRLEMRCLAHLLHRKPEASYILLSSQLAPLVRSCSH